MGVYDFYEYRGEGTYSLDTDLAKIIEQNGKKCKIEILTGRSGQFTLYCETPDGETEELLINIKTWFGGKNESTVGVVK